MTPEQHEMAKSMAEDLIRRGRVRTWRQLGKAFGISPQAAQMRFGRTYGLQLPRRTPVEYSMVSVSLNPELDARLEAARMDLARREIGQRASRAAVVRALLEEHLPEPSEMVSA